MTIYIRTQLDELLISITSDIVPRVGERITIIDEHTDQIKDYIVKSVDYTCNISRFSEYLQRVTIYV
jgi:hypothetical protein